MREGMHFFEAEALCERIAHIPDALWAGFSQFNLQFFAISRLLVKPIDTHFESAKRFLERLLEGTTNGHDLAHRFHLSGKAGIDLREFLECETRHLGHDIVDGG